jgi:hypothetical protein
MGLALGFGIADSPARPANAVVLTDFTDSKILVGPPPTDHALAQVAPDKTTTVTIQVTDIDDPSAQAGKVGITVDLSEVSGRVDVVGLSSDCISSSADTIDCEIQLPDVAPPVPVPAQAIRLMARAGTPVGSAGTIHLSWALNTYPAPSTASIDVTVIAAATPTNPPTTNPAPPTTRTTTRPPTHPATTPAVIKPVPMTPLADPSPSPSPSPEVTMTPDPTPQPNVAGADPLAGGPTTPIPFADPPADGPAWRSPALYLSLGTAAAGLLIALVYAVISLRKAGQDPS